MRGTRVFDILVYRLSPKERTREFEKLRKESTNPEGVYKGWQDNFGERFWASLSNEQQKELKEYWEKNFFFSQEARGFLYNDVVGYLVIFINSDQISAHYWLVEGKIRRDMKSRIFRYHYKVFEFWVSREYSSGEIFKRIEGELSKLKSEWPFKGRYLDMEIFSNTGPLVDWKKLIDLEQQHS